MLATLKRLTLVAAIASTLAGCRGAAPLLPAGTASTATSRINSAVSAGPLLYVTDGRTHTVVVFTYPAGKLAGTLRGFSVPEGDCADAAGNVWIVDAGASTIVEYAHGGAAPKTTLADPGQFPTACAVNPRTGDLAVANAATSTFGPGSISIYAHAAGTPNTYANDKLAIPDSIAYDDRGDLFVAGTQPRARFYYGELRKGARSLEQIHWPKSVIGGGILWDGRHIAVVDAALGFPIPIFAIDGKRIAARTVIAGPCNLFQFTVYRGRLICSNKDGKRIQIYAYPTGGAILSTITNPGLRPVASVVSRT